MKLTKRQLKQIIVEEYTKLRTQGLLKEAPGDGLNDPEVAAAYDDLQSMSSGGFAPDTDFSFLDEWPYTEALDILQDEEYERQTRDDPSEDYDDEDALYDSMEASMRARQNRNMYESFTRNVSFPFSEIAEYFQDRGYKVVKAHAGDDRGAALFQIPISVPGGTRDFGYYVDVKYEYGTFYFYWYLRTMASPSSQQRVKVIKPGGGKPRWEVDYIEKDLKVVMDEIDYEISVHDAEGTHPFDLGLPPSKFAYKGG